MAPLDQLHRSFAGKDFTVIGLESWSRNGPARLELYRQQYGVTFPLLYGGPAYGYGAWGSPTVVLLRKDGRVVASRRGSCDTGALGSLIQYLLDDQKGAER
ncbi:MAG: hypothetical protein HY471_00190 [Candidatus Sungbacteria bacterium]|nr:hypothetical protein [Candidatus Sungbacteria bacterium]